MLATRRRQDKVGDQVGRETRSRERMGLRLALPVPLHNLIFFTEPTPAKARARRDADLGEGAPIWVQGPQQSHLPVPGPNGNADVWPQ